MNTRVAKFLKISGLVFLVISLGWAILQGYSATWTGFGDYTTPSGEYMRGKTLWDWMELFLIPILLSIGVFLLNRSDRELERRRTEERAKLEREIATNRKQAAALPACLDRMAATRRDMEP